MLKKTQDGFEILVRGQYYGLITRNRWGSWVLEVGDNRISRHPNTPRTPWPNAVAILSWVKTQEGAQYIKSLG